MSKTETEISEFKGNPIFNIHKLDEEGKRPENYSLVVGFGLGKAKAIIENIEEIKKFVAANDKKEE